MRKRSLNDDDTLASNIFSLCPCGYPRTTWLEEMVEISPVPFASSSFIINMSLCLALRLIYRVLGERGLKETHGCDAARRWGTGTATGTGKSVENKSARLDRIRSHLRQPHPPRPSSPPPSNHCRRYPCTESI